jgi:putative ABC transport system substrate-binding protein
VPVIGLLSTASPTEVLHLLAAFHQGLKEVGYVESRNVLVEYRWAENQYDRLPALATDLVRRQVQVIVATPTASWTAAKAATATIPIVFQGGADPVKLGLVASLSRPGGNATGVINISAELDAKPFDVLRELVQSLWTHFTVTDRAAGKADSPLDRCPPRPPSDRDNERRCPCTDQTGTPQPSGTFTSRLSTDTK